MVQHFQYILDVIFNQDRCSLCRRPGIYTSRRPWCQHCHQAMLDLSAAYPVCDHCGKYLCEDGILCADCRREAPLFTIARSVGPYEAEYRIAIKVFKFMGRQHLAWKMGRLMASIIKKEKRFWPIDIIIPVPISRQSFCDRGFNQTVLLGERIAKLLKRPLGESFWNEPGKGRASTIYPRRNGNKIFWMLFGLKTRKRYIIRIYF